MNNILKNKDSDGVSILWVVAVVVSLSILMVTISFVIFLSSGAYDTVKIITAAANTLQKDDLKGYDTTSPVRADTLGSYMKTVPQKVNSLDDEADFNQDVLDKQDLGY